MARMEHDSTIWVGAVETEVRAPLLRKDAHAFSSTELLAYVAVPAPIEHASAILLRFDWQKPYVVVRKYCKLGYSSVRSSWPMYAACQRPNISDYMARSRAQLLECKITMLALHIDTAGGGDLRHQVSQ